MKRLPELSKGDSGAAVRRAKALLNTHLPGAPMRPAKDDFGPKMRRQVRAFQRRRGLKPDGVIGTKTWAALLGLS